MTCVICRFTIERRGVYDETQKSKFRQARPCQGRHESQEQSQGVAAGCHRRHRGAAPGGVLHHRKLLQRPFPGPYHHQRPQLQRQDRPGSEHRHEPPGQELCADLEGAGRQDRDHQRRGHRPDLRGQRASGSPAGQHLPLRLAVVPDPGHRADRPGQHEL